MDEARDAIINTALAMTKTIERGEPFIFEAQEGNFLVFRCDDGSLGIVRISESTSD